MVRTVGATISNEIGYGYKGGEIDSVTHKILHGLSGGVTGFISDDGKGVISGTIGASSAETFVDIFEDSYDKHTVASIYKGIGAFSGGVLGRNAQSAFLSSDTAIENNCLGDSAVIFSERRNMEQSSMSPEEIQKYFETQRQATLQGIGGSSYCIVSS